MISDPTFSSVLFFYCSTFLNWSDVTVNVYMTIITESSVAMETDIQLLTSTLNSRTQDCNATAVNESDNLLWCQI